MEHPMPVDFKLTPEQKRLQLDARAFAKDVLSGVAAATALLPTPQQRYTATRPFYEQAIAAGFLRRLIPQPLGGEGTGVVDMAILAEEFHAVDVNVSLTLLGTMLGLFPLVLAGNPEQQSRFFKPFISARGAPPPPLHSASRAEAPISPRLLRRKACERLRAATAMIGSSQAQRNGCPAAPAGTAAALMS
jgi:hypothetical protein